MIRKLINRLIRRNRLPEVKHQIKYAFTVGGIDYYEMDDLFNMPYKRALKAFSVYEELRMRCTYEYLKAHCQAIDNILNATKFNVNNLVELKRLNNQLRERLEFVVPEDIGYKLASVVFFDDAESPIDYDAAYAQKKIAHWKKHMRSADFFLQTPLQRLIPFLKEREENLEMYFKVAEELTKMHLESIFSNLSEQQKRHWSFLRSRPFAAEQHLN
jgi:hypothetical protein